MFECRRMFARMVVIMLLVILVVSKGEDPTSSNIKIGDLISMSIKSKSQVTALLLILGPIDRENNFNISQMINLTCPGQGEQQVDNSFETPVETANFRNCLEVQEGGFNASGEYTIYPYLCCPNRTITVYCDLQSDGGGWTLIQRRGDYPQQEDFFRSWKEYEEGFGKLGKDFWLGLDHIHALTSQRPNEVRFDLEDFDGISGWAKYGHFSISDEDLHFKLSIGNYSGDVGDGMKFHDGMSFSTKDKDNDDSTENCATQWIGGWWYKDCQHVSLNGPYVGPRRDPGAEAMLWFPWRYFSPLKMTEIKIRPRVH